MDVEIVVSEQGEFPRLKDKLDKSIIYIFKEHVPKKELSDFNTGEVRNDAIENSSGEFIYTNDSDVVFMNEDFLAKCKELLDPNHKLVLYRPFMRRLPIENFREFKKLVEQVGISKALASLNLSNEFLATTDNAKRDLKITFAVDHEGSLKVRATPMDEFLRCTSNPSIKDKESPPLFENLHYGGSFFRREHFEDVGGYYEQFINWGYEDVDLQWKFKNMFNLQFFPKIEEFAVLHLDHEKMYISPKTANENEKKFAGRIRRGAYSAIEEDKKWKENRSNFLPRGIKI